MKKGLIVLACLLLLSCHKAEKFRIVDAEGRPAKITKVVPKFNEEQMEKQKEVFVNPKGKSPKVSKFQQKTSDSPVFHDEDTYPDSVFVDKITNYNQKTDEGLVLDRRTNTNDISLVKSEKLPKTTEPQKPAVAPAPKKSSNSNAKGFYLQIGAFRNKKNADTLYVKYKNTLTNIFLEESLDGGRKNYKVISGPYPNKNSAEDDMSKVITMGHYDVYVTEKK
jgi:septal ring-binding cell division protein DamX